MIRLVLVSLFVSTYCACSAPHSSNHANSKQTGALAIAVVGDGVPTDGPRNCPSDTTPLNRAQGEDMWLGVNAAFQSAPIKLRERLYLIRDDDCATQADAVRIANTLRQNHDLLAVIGHATSATTKAAIRIYNDIGVPMLTPIATANNIVDELPEQHPGAFLRLPPADDPTQVLAVLNQIDSLNATRVVIVRDKSRDAAVYSDVITRKLVSRLGKRVAEKLEIDKDELALEMTVPAIISARPQVIVFVGYGTSANHLLPPLARELTAKGVAKPSLILTDGCLIEDLNPCGLTAYLTFPAP